MKNKFITLTDTATLWLIVLTSLSIALPTAFMSITTVLLMIVWILSGNFKTKFERIISNPAAMAAIALFSMYAIGTIYSSASWDYSLKFLLKYQKLLFIPLIISVMASDKYRVYAINAFLIGMVSVLIISYLMWLGVVPHHVDLSQGYFVFKGRIAHNIFMSFAMYLMMHRALKSNGLHRYAWMALSILAALNIMFLVNGRTGQITMLALIIWFIYETWGIKIISYVFALGILGFALLQAMHMLPHSRLTDIQQEMAGGSSTSSGQRLEMYENTLTLIEKHPVFGGGTGSLENEYRTIAEQEKLSLIRVPNSHNQFLLTTQELGIFGLALLLAMWALHWKASYKTSEPQYGFALRGLVLTIVVGSLFNSLLLDAGEGKFYCILAGVLLSSYTYKKTNT
jgi:O-antigen ligase